MFCCQYLWTIEHYIGYHNKIYLTSYQYSFKFNKHQLCGGNIFADWCICYNTTSWKIWCDVNNWHFAVFRTEINDAYYWQNTKPSWWKIRKLFRQTIQTFILYATPVFVKLVAMVELGRQRLQNCELYFKTTIVFINLMVTVKLLMIIHFYTYLGTYKVE